MACVWASKDTCFPSVRWAVWKVAVILLEPDKMAALQVRSSQARSLAVTADGRSCMGGPVGMLRSCWSSEASIITSRESQPLDAGLNRGHQRPGCVVRKQAVVRPLPCSLVNRRCYLFTALSPPQLLTRLEPRSLKEEQCRASNYQ